MYATEIANGMYMPATVTVFQCPLWRALQCTCMCRSCIYSCGTFACNDAVATKTVAHAHPAFLFLLSRFCSCSCADMISD